MNLEQKYKETLGKLDYGRQKAMRPPTTGNVFTGWNNSLIGCKTKNEKGPKVVMAQEPVRGHLMAVLGWVSHVLP